MTSIHSLTSKVLAISFLLGYLVFYPVFDIAAELAREQESEQVQVNTDKVEVSPKQEKLKSPSFFRYFYRIISAPFVLIATFPRSEDPDLYNSYLEWVNRGTNRNWKQKEYHLKKEHEKVNYAENQQDAQKEDQGKTSEAMGNSESA